MIEKLMYEFYQLPKLYEKMALEAGDNFNLFNVLGRQFDELSHSRFLGELLNPNGSHGQGNIFLKLFLDCCNIQNFETINAKVDLEYHIGEKTDTTGGRIDILIQKNGIYIAIENKIWAGDQDAQLLRYHNFIKKNPNSRLIYLNLFGTDAQQHSTKGEQFPYKIISYQKDILNWLLLCREKASTLPFLRENISQYIDIIKSLTNKAKMDQEIADNITTNPEKLAAYFNLIENKEVRKAVDNRIAVYEEILCCLKTKLEEIARAKELVLVYDVAFRERWKGFYFSNEKLASYNICIGYNFDGRCCRDLIRGFFYNNRQAAKHEKSMQIQEKFKQIFEVKAYENEYWLCYQDHTHKDWGSKEFEMVNNGEMAKLIASEVDIMLEIITSIE